MTVGDVVTSVLPHRRAEAERFAAMVEGRRVNGGPEDHPELAELAVLAAALAPVEHSPDPAFRLALRERLVAEAVVRSERAATAPADVRPDSRSTGTTGDRHPPRWRTAAATFVVAGLVSGAGAAAASHRALPGDSLYGLKRQIESVELALARTDLGRGRELLEQAEARLTEAERLAASSAVEDPETQQALQATLDDMAEATSEGAATLLSSYRETGDPEPLVLLDRFATEQRERLADLMALLSPELRARMSPVLDELARLDQRTAALLGSTTAFTALAAARDSGDGWAVSRVLGTSGGSGTPAGGTATGLTGGAGTLTAGGGTLADGGSTGSAGSGTGVVGELLDDATGALTGSSGSGGSGGSGSSGGSGLGAGGTSGTDLGDAVEDVADAATAVAEPVSSAVPLPTSAPLPTTNPLPSLGTSSITAPLPTPTACVTLLGVETC